MLNTYGQQNMVILALECITTSCDRLSAHIITGIFAGSWQITVLWKHLFNDMIYSSLRAAEEETKGCYGACCCKWLMPCKCGLLWNYVVMGICKIVNIQCNKPMFLVHWPLANETPYESILYLQRKVCLCCSVSLDRVSCMFADLLSNTKN